MYESSADSVISKTLRSITRHLAKATVVPVLLNSRDITVAYAMAIVIHFMLTKSNKIFDWFGQFLPPSIWRDKWHKWRFKLCLKNRDGLFSKSLHDHGLRMNVNVFLKGRKIPNNDSYGRITNHKTFDFSVGHRLLTFCVIFHIGTVEQIYIKNFPRIKSTFGWPLISLFYPFSPKEVIIGSELFDSAFTFIVYHLVIIISFNLFRWLIT